MPDVEYHGWTHRPKSEGGTDPIEFPSGSAMPFAYSYLTYFVAEDDTEYSLFAGDDGGYAGNATGAAASMYIGNDPGRDTFYVLNNTTDENQCLAIQGDNDGMYAFDAAVLYDTDFDGTVALYPDSAFGLWTNSIPTYGTPANWPSSEWRILTSSEDHNPSVRISSVVYLEPDGVALSSMFSIIFWQLSGSSQTVKQAWAVVTKLSGVDSAPSREYPPI